MFGFQAFPLFEKTVLGEKVKGSTFENCLQLMVQQFRESSFSP
ncbi:unnamed protein product, partial [Larinioides sclopetarius]